MNKAGRVCLAKSVFSSLPVYSMQTIWLPQGVCDDIDKCTRAFIWGGNREGRATHLVEWNKVAKLQVFRGLGMR